MAPRLAVIMKSYKSITFFILSYIENIFNGIGFTIAKNPWKTIIACWVFVLLSALGFLRFHHEKNPVKLWTPPHSNFAHDAEWLMNTFKQGYREQIILIKANDVLVPEVLRELNSVSQKVINTTTNDGITWSDVCFKIPMIDVGIASLLNYKSKKKNSTVDDFDPSIEFPQSQYCAILDLFKRDCMIQNLLEIWNFKDKKLQTITKQEILNKIATTNISPVTGHRTNFEKLLGGIKRNESGHIVSADTLLSFWMVHVDFTKVDMNKVGNDLGTADWATEESLKWESEFLKTMKTAESTASNFQLFYTSSRSFGDISSAVMFQDIPMLMIGIFLMVIYVQLVLSKFNCVEARFILGFLGLLSIGMAFIVACSLCSLFGVFYGPVHTSFPFLLMGLGVDDMFVMMACWNHHATRINKPLPERIGLMLRHAGVSITVTSLTDFIVFLVGSSTVLPSLKSYCIYAGAGVIATYVFVVTFFTACFTLDQQRLEQNRNSLFPWYIHKRNEKNMCSQKQYMEKGLNFIYKKVVLTPVGKIIVILLALIFGGFGLQRTLKLEQKFDPNWFISETSYLSKYLKQRFTYYPMMGYEAAIYLGGLNYTEEYQKINSLVNKLENNTDIFNVTSSWVKPFSDYMKTHFNKDLSEVKLSDTEWNTYLSRYLFSPKTSKYQENFQFQNDLECGTPASQILVSNIKIQFKVFQGPNEYLPAMHRTYDLVKTANFSTGDRFTTAWGKVFGNWITDEIIDDELARNLLLALVCVMACTLILIANLHVCFWILICVLLTMISVCGCMQLWNLTVDLVSCIALTLAIGLCVDYAAHIGYTFLTTNEPTRQERVLKTVTSIGGAVLNGGLSTLLAMSMLSQSEAYTFQAFFKIFFLVVLFGQFYGVVFLPVVLSLIGPEPYNSHVQVEQADQEEQH